MSEALICPFNGDESGGSLVSGQSFNISDTMDIILNITFNTNQSKNISSIGSNYGNTGYQTDLWNTYSITYGGEYEKFIKYINDYVGSGVCTLQTATYYTTLLQNTFPQNLVYRTLSVDDATVNIPTSSNNNFAFNLRYLSNYGNYLRSNLHITWYSQVGSVKQCITTGHLFGSAFTTFYVSRASSATQNLTYQTNSSNQGYSITTETSNSGSRSLSAFKGKGNICLGIGMNANHFIAYRFFNNVTFSLTFRVDLALVGSVD